MVGAKQELHEFREEKIQAVKLILEVGHLFFHFHWLFSNTASPQKHVEQYSRWYEETTNNLAEEQVEAAGNRWIATRESTHQSAVSQRFLTLGYVEAGIQAIQWKGQLLRGGGLTDRRWNHIRPVLERDIQESREQRLASERLDLVKSRTQILNGVCRAYLRSVVPFEWLYHPGIDDLIKLTIID
ncbi:hypothetical protein Hypma_012171 [Hypsizygus marmoreus]|uniref:Uncharacterized protein n=1 Tax=Hypsizygus marmoreus TaxID=39966 RepID=A0A369JPR6_HYPMA|nr:hypothetical protein Hypma_012171 [Hypsizygus marmoreus]